jgi:tetratricopeptide (TPR) repeat protein
MLNLRKNLFHPAIFIPILLITFILVVAVVKVFVWPAVKQFQANNYKENAREFLEKENYRNAFIEIRKAILKDPGDLESYQIALKSAEKSADHFQYVLGLLSKLMEMDSNNPDNFVKFILLNLQIDNLTEAQQAYENYPENSMESEDYHRLGYSIGMGTRDFDKADTHITKLIELRPDDLKLQFTLSTLRLESSDDEDIKLEAANSLSELADTEIARTPALRVLLTHSLVEQDKAKVEEYIQQLSAMGNIVIRDHLLILQAQKFVDEESFAGLVDNFLLNETTDPDDISMTLDFLQRNEMLQRASKWLEFLPDTLKINSVVAKKASQIYFLTKDYEKLKEVLLDEDWSKQEFGRFLLLALTSKVEGDPIAFRKYWQQCLIEIEDNEDLLKHLFETVSTWGWENESIEVLERIFHEQPADDQTFNVLINHFMGSGDTNRALEILIRRINFLPDDLRSKNNFALLSLLSGVNQASAFGYAKENFETDNENPYYTTTWAFALELQGRSQEALNLIEFLTDEERNDPQRAVYIAKIYHETGDQKMANQLLSQVDESTLFAEEKVLLRSIRRSIQEAGE